MPHTVRNKFKESSFGRAFIVTLFFVTLASGLFWLDFFRSYDAEVTVLVVDKTQGGKSLDVAQNMVELTRTLSFYNRLLTENELIDDAFVGYSSDERKGMWQKLVSVNNQNSSGVLIIRARGDTPEASKQLALQTAQTMFSIAGLYYDIRTNIDMRIVDGPFISYRISNPLFYAGTCLLSSFFLTTLFFFLLKFVPYFLQSKKPSQSSLDIYKSGELIHEDESLTHRAYPEFSAHDSFPFIDPKKFIPEKPSTLSFEDTPQEEEKYESSQSLIIEEPVIQKNISVPFDERDLPVADEDSLPFTFETIPEEVALTEEISEELAPEKISFAETIHSDISVKPSEPTQEEYRRRLNVLLAHIEK